MLKNFSLVAAAICGLFGTMASEANAADYRVLARMGARDAFSAKSVYRERIVGDTLVQRFNVSIEDGVPGASYEIFVNGNLFGTIIANNLGNAELEFRTVVVDDNPHDEEPPLPVDFPHINVGDTITVGSLIGTYR
ncbi:MAG: hypothetical protein ACOYN0_09480 [Phycisphaerales bacterium]